MKFNFHVSPNYRGKLTTAGIMRDLTIGLMIIFLCACCFYGFGQQDGIRLVGQLLLLLACSLITTFVCEFIFAKVTRQEPLKFIRTSYGWVTAIILTMMCPITITPYALIIATIFAIVVGRLLFGGFAQNVFNPAAVGRAVIFAAFTGATTGIISGATPVTELAGDFHWLPGNQEVLESFFSDFGSFKTLLIGNYHGAIGETFSLAIILVGIWLIYRRVMEWRIPVVYLATIAVMAALIALLCGLEPYNGVPAVLWYPALHLLTGGVLFGAFFMLTDPVTSPTDPAARVFWAMCAGIITVLIRLKGNLPEGCLYSILIMNCFTPMIEGALDGVQLQQKKKAIIMIVCAAFVACGICFYVSTTVQKVDALSSATTESSATTSATGFVWDSEFEEAGL